MQRHAGRASPSLLRRHVIVGKRTVKEGECCAVWTASGARRLIEGPQRVRLWWSHVRFLDRHVADGNQYLVVQNRDGSKEHLRGPVALFFDPCQHEAMEVRDAVVLAANEAVVVYQEGACSLEAHMPPGPKLAPGTGAIAAAEPVPQPSSFSSVVNRRIERGPKVFIPSSSEWCHTFSWHGSVGAGGKGSKTGAPNDEKRPHALTFQKLRVMPDQMYYSVRDVRTSDDARLTIHLMIFYTLLDVEKMLDASNDPIGDFINAVSADVIVFGAANTYESLLQQTAELSCRESFPILCSRMDETGYSLLKVVFRGYSTSSDLQGMHDEAIAKRTRLRLQSDTVEVEQAQQATQLKCKQERSKAEQELDEASTRHHATLAAVKADQARASRAADNEQELRFLEERGELELRQQKKRNDEDLRRFAQLKELGVNLTEYMCVAEGAMPDHHVRIDSGGPAAGAAQLHLELPRGSKRG